MAEVSELDFWRKMSDMRPAENYLEAGYGEKIITPPLGIDLTGYGFYLDRKAESVLDDLKVRALYLRNGTNRLILICCDLIGFSVEFSDRIRKEIALLSWTEPENILLACTHTHSGPATTSLPGLGEIDPAYTNRLPDFIKEAVSLAERDCERAKLSFFSEAVESIGFNRRLRNFVGIDPYLRGIILNRVRGKIFLLNYPCHAVTLGRTKEISADWPGALLSEMEKVGHQAIFFQGFCGDIDPVTGLNHWDHGTKDDLALYGKILSQRALKAQKHAQNLDEFSLQAKEVRINLPLSVCGRKEIEREAQAFGERYDEFPGARKFSEDWKRRAIEKNKKFRRQPQLENIPVQALAIGKVRILGLAGEVFAVYSLKLQKKLKPLLTIGLANGVAGYFPTREAFRDLKDYACYCAPKIYSIFPFTPDIESILIKESQRLFRNF